MKKQFLFLLLGVLCMLGSCVKNYTCTCIDDKTNTIETTVTVTGKNSTEAESDCMLYETAGSSCNVQQGTK